MGSNADLGIHLSVVVKQYRILRCVNFIREPRGLGRCNLVLTKMVLWIAPKNEGHTEASVVHWTELLPAFFKE